MTPASAASDRDTAREQADFSIGDVVVDHDDDPDSRDRAVVINQPPVAADEWVLRRQGDDGVTVADDNPAYDPDALVVVVMFVDELEAWDVQWTPDAPLPVAEAPNGTTYAFPPGRLEVVDTYGDAAADSDDTSAGETDADHDSGGENSAEGNGAPTLRDQLDAIAGAAAELNVDSVAVDTFREVVVIEKLGSQYHVAADGTVDADDPLAGRLEAAVAAEVDR